MGAGAGAAAPVDNDLSPRFVAIEKAQAELRQEVAVRAERKRELEFLEKGGNPLDFQVGDIINPSRSSTDPLADQLLPIVGEARYAVNGVKNGVLVENCGVCDVAIGEFTELGHTDGRWSIVSSVPARERSISQWDGKGSSASSSLQNPTGVEKELTAVKGREGAGGGWTRTRGQSYMRRNRHRIKCDGLTDVSVPGGSNNLVVKHGSPKMSSGPVTAEDDSLEKGLWVDATCQALPASLSYVGLGSKANSESLVDGPMNATPSQKHSDEPLLPIATNNGWVDPSKSDSGFTSANVVEDDFKDDGQAVVEDGGETSGGSTHQSSFSMTDAKDSVPSVPISIPGEKQCWLAQETQASEGDLELVKSISEDKVAATTTWADVNGKVSSGSSQAEKCCFMVPTQADMWSKVVAASALDRLDPDVKKVQNASIGGSGVHGANLDHKLISGGPVFGSGNLVPKLEDCTAPFAPKAAESESETLRIQGGNVCPSLASTGDDFKFHGQSSAPMSGALRSNVRSVNNVGASTNRFPGVVLPWEKEQDPAALAEVERRKATISAAAKKAQEDCILEEAQTIMSSRSQAAELDRRRPFHEPVKRKSHWDFVLEEMAWMANDFMQERLWKRAAAAQFSRCAAFAQLGSNSADKELLGKQMHVAHILADAVAGFWQTISSSMIDAKRHIIRAENANMLQNGFSPTNADVAGEKEVLGGRKSSLIKEYCVRFLKESFSVSSDFGAQAEAPPTPERMSEVSPLDTFWDYEFSELPLTYTRPEGAFEIYEMSVAAHWAAIEAEHEQARQETRAGFESCVDVHVAGEELVTSDLTPEPGYMMGLSPSRRGSSDEEVYSHSLPGNSYDSGGTTNLIAKKKRKKIQKAIPVRFSESPSMSALSHEQTMGSTGQVDYGFPSSAVTGKRSSPGGVPSSSLVSIGTIPIKRLRTSAVAARQRAAGMGPVTSGLMSRGRISSGLSHTQQEVTTSPVPGNGPASNGNGTKAVQNASNNAIFSKTKKRKKSKHFNGTLCKANVGDSGAGGVATSSVKREHLKRKGDHTSSVGPTGSSDIGTDGLDTPDTPGSQNKKSKLAKQASDISPDMIASTGFTPCQAAAQLSNVPCKVVRQSCSRDRSNRKTKPGKVSLNQSGPGIPWSAAEDQTILYLVHSLGPNWELVSDVLRFNSQQKGIFRKPKHCRERHRHLVEHASGEGSESADDSNVLQRSSAVPGLSKGPPEDTGKVHFERIIHLVQKYHLFKPQNGGQGQQQYVQTHASHANIMAQYGMNGITGAYYTPLELCDRSSNDLIAPQYQMQQQHAGGLGLPNVAGGPNSRPGSAGMPGLQLSPPLTPSSASIQSAREGHRLAAMRPMLQDEGNQIRYARMQQRGLQPGTSVTTGLPMMGPSDCTVPVLPSGTGHNMMTGPKRAMSLPRSGLPGLAPGINSSGLGGMPSPNGIGLSNTGINSTAVSGQMNLMRRPRDSVQLRVDSWVQSGRAPEEQRQFRHDLQQHPAVQGNLPQSAAAGLGTFNNSMSNTMMSSPSHGFASQQQLQSPQPQPMQHQPLQQNALQQSSNAYFAAQERQLQQQQEHQQQEQQVQLQQQPQQKQRIYHQQPMRQNSSTQLQQQSAIAQHLVSQQAHMHPQQSHVLALQQQGVPQQHIAVHQQQQLMPTSSLPTASLQLPSPPPLSATATALSPSPQCQPPNGQVAPSQVSQPSDHMSHFLQGKLPLSPKQAHKHQQVPQQAEARAIKGATPRGMAMTHGHPTSQSVAALSSGLSGNLPMASHMPPQQVPNLMQGQRPLQVHSQMHVGKQLTQASQHASAGKGQVQGQGQGQQALSQGLPSAVQQAQQQVLPPTPGKQQPSLKVPVPACGLGAAGNPRAPAQQLGLQRPPQESQPHQQHGGMPMSVPMRGLGPGQVRPPYQFASAHLATQSASPSGLVGAIPGGPAFQASACPGPGKASPMARYGVQTRQPHSVHSSGAAGVSQRTVTSAGVSPSCVSGANGANASPVVGTQSPLDQH